MRLNTTGPYLAPRFPTPARPRQGRSGIGRNAVLLGLLVALVLPASTAVPAGGRVAPGDGDRASYIVQLAGEPLATYGGGIAGLEATGPGVTGRRLDTQSLAALRYRAFLDAAEEAALAQAGARGVPIFYRYRVALFGFAARLTPAEAARLRAVPGVRSVIPDRITPLLTRHDDEEPGGDPGLDGPDFLGLREGLWARLGGPDRAGEGVVVGVLDTGIHPEHPSFADDPVGDDGDRRFPGPAYEPPAFWRGACQAGEEFPVTTCNNKLIGARYFVEGFGADRLHDDEFLSARDVSGHGTHVAATAVGNHGVVPRIGGGDLGIPFVSGIAPRSYLSTYKVCWQARDDGAGSCASSDSVAAVDAAVADGVDVINYSVGSETDSVIGAVATAFLFAVDAGVFVAGAAGNAGPQPGTVGSPAAVPWITAVGATTLPRTFESTLTVTGGHQRLEAIGATLTSGLGPAPLVDAAGVPADGVEEENSELCLPGSLQPDAVAGKAVLCKRGTNARVEKSQVVRDAGGVGMVLYNATDDEDLASDLHFVPAVHIPLSVGRAIKQLLEGEEPVEIEIGGSAPGAARGDAMAAFSSRGPQSSVPDVPKPDLAAPGVGILAAATPAAAGTPGPGETFRLLNGTSMAAPHVAGAAALLSQLEPARSPAALKSALMTTAAVDVVNHDGETPAGPFDMGSGRIDPTRAAEPGLVLDVGLSDYLRYLKGQDPRLVEGDVAPLAAVDLNLPAVSLGALPGVARTARTFTSVDSTRSTWRGVVEGLEGVEVTLTPGTFHIAPGRSQTVELAFALDGASLDSYAVGALVLTNRRDNRTVRLPLSVRPVRIASPPFVEVVTDEESGRAPIQAVAGYRGDLSALGWGLALPRVQTGHTVASGRGAPRFEASAGVNVFDVDVPPGSQVLGGAISNADGGAPDTDLDLYLFFDEEGDGFDAGDQIAASAGPDSDEAIFVALPRPGRYRFAVVGFRISYPFTTYDFTTWLAADPSPDDPATPPGAPGLAVTGDPKPVTPAQVATLTLEWSQLPADGLYVGLVTFHDTATPDPLQPRAHSVVHIVKGPAPPPPTRIQPRRRRSPRRRRPHTPVGSGHRRRPAQP